MYSTSRGFHPGVPAHLTVDLKVVDCDAIARHHFAFRGDEVHLGLCQGLVCCHMAPMQQIVRIGRREQISCHSTPSLAFLALLCLECYLAVRTLSISQAIRV